MNRSIVQIFMLLQTVRSYQGVHLPEAGLKETAYKHHSNLRVISYKEVIVQNTGTAFLSSYDVFDNNEVCHQRTIYRDSIEIVIILNFSLQHDWGWK